MSTTIKIQVELFGVPRLRSGRREVGLALPREVSRQQVVCALAEACPALVGNALREDRSDLQEGYVFNHNGRSFIGGDNISLQPGDSLLLLSSQAGG